MSRKSSYPRRAAEMLHKELGHDLDGALNHRDRCYNAIQCLAFWGLHGTLDGHEHWAPKTPYTAVKEVVKQLEKLPSKATAITLLNALGEMAHKRRPDLKAATKYKAVAEATDTGHVVEKMVVVERAPAILAATKKKAGSKKAKQLKAKDSKADEQVAQ